MSRRQNLVFSVDFDYAFYAKSDRQRTQRITTHPVHLAPKAVIGDGILHVFAMRKKSRVKTIVSFLRAMQGTHLDDREVNVDDGRQRMVVIKTKNCTITTEKIGRDVSNLCVDGEISQIPASHTLVIGVSERFVPFYS